ncbi:hypothetical protein HX055_18235, partial [Myroides odoratimimus]|nr:hypothetical protein [Myroides odoratimimus]
MKKILYTLVALAFSSATFAQPYPIKSDGFYQGAIFNEKSLKSTEPKRLATATETSHVLLPSFLGELAFEISDYSKDHWHSIIDKHYTKLAESNNNEGFSFSSPSQVNSLKYVDK